MAPELRRGCRVQTALTGSALLALLLFAATAQAEVAVLTMTPGPRLFERFGHTALRVDDRVYNFGTFEADDPRLIGKFLGRRIEYWLSVQPLAVHYEHYANRVITEQLLALTPDEERELALRLADNARPEHRAYRYDFFLDNCATRVRDAVDVASGGALGRSGAQAHPGGSYRQLVEGVLAGPPLLASAVSLLLNASTDRPTTRWQDAFLPHELQALLANTTRTDGRRLVAATRVVAGPAARPRPSGRRVVATLLEWLLLLLALPLPLALVARGERARRRLASLALALAGVVGGLLGLVLLVAALTPYPCARGNATVLLLHPLLLTLLPASLALLRGRSASPSVRWARGLLTAGLAAALAELAAHAVGLGHQRHVGLALLVVGWSAAGRVVLGRLISEGARLARTAAPESASATVDRGPG